MMDGAAGCRYIGKICRRSGAAYTLLELLVAMGLAVLTISMLSYSTLRISATVRMSESRFARKSKMISTAEQIRWQLRCLYTGVLKDDSERPNSHLYPGTLKYQLYGRRGSKLNSDILIFNTTYIPKSRGTVEVGYCILTDEQTGKPYLAYRQFPWVDYQGLHDYIDFTDAPWTVCSRDIVGMSLEYSHDSKIWQQEWTENTAPQWVRITLIPDEGEPFVTQVAPAVISARWH